MGRFFLLLFWIVPAAVAQQGTVAERYLLSAMNDERAQHQLAPLRMDAALHRSAELHAREMARRGGISHQFAGEPELAERAYRAGAHFSRVTENVAEGRDVVTLHEAWMRSPGHRANVLDAEVDAVGIAAVVLRGQTYAVEDFARTVEPLTLEQQERVVAIKLDQAGLELLPSEDARRMCAMDAGYAGAERPAFVVRYTVTNLAQLPEKLSARLARGMDSKAAVGACPADPGPFTEYRLAVVLYR